MRTRVVLPQGCFELIDDSYNASPTSMIASFQVLGRSRPGDGGRRIAVLGDMLELGEDAPALHAALARSLGRKRRRPCLYRRSDDAASSRRLAGGDAGGARDRFGVSRRGWWRRRCGPGDVLTVKGSAGSRMRTVVETLLALQASGRVQAGVTGGGPKRLGHALPSARSVRRGVHAVQRLPLHHIPVRRGAVDGAGDQLLRWPEPDTHPAVTTERRPADTRRWSGKPPVDEARHADDGRVPDPAGARRVHAAVGRSRQWLRLGCADGHHLLRRHRLSRRLPQDRASGQPRIAWAREAVPAGYHRRHRRRSGSLSSRHPGCRASSRCRSSRT